MGRDVKLKSRMERPRPAVALPAGLTVSYGEGPDPPQEAMDPYRSAEPHRDRGELLIRWRWLRSLSVVWVLSCAVYDGLMVHWFSHFAVVTNSSLGLSLASGKQQELLAGLPAEEQALFIEQAIEGQLGIADRHVGGELRR